MSEVFVDSGLLALCTLARLHGVAVDEASLRHEFGSQAFDTTRLLLAARKLGLHARAVRQPPERLALAPLPAIAQDQEGNYFILARCEPGEGQGRKVLIQRAGQGLQALMLEEFLALWNGQLIYLTSRASLAAGLARFDFSWFIPALVKYRHLFGEVLLVSLALQLIALATPMFFQVVMDKVLVNRSMQTLNVIAIGLVCAILFEATLNGIRGWVSAHTCSKIDVELGARLFRHLLNLPLSYFQSRRVGDSVARVRELENIRSFLTGNAMTVLLDLLFSFVFIAVMCWYSVKLTLLVLASVPAYLLLSLFFAPMIRARLDVKFARGAENQSFLVETVGGIDTVKALAVEPRWFEKWDKQLAAYVTASLNVSSAALLASAGVQLISKLTTAGIMWVGARLAIDREITVGELVAFNMLAGQVTNPVLRLAQLWNDFQQVGISMSRLGDILNTQAEDGSQKTRLPRLLGSIVFDQVSFRYRPDTADILRQISMNIAPGELIGIVGRSGSGKSTLTRLVQRLYPVERGRILIDGQDIALIATTSLRQQVGVVLQENLLFNRSVRDNIALTDPAAPLERVMEVAKLAGAHDFICELPDGYDTLVGEHGTGLSGGQRQRLAIARALIADPRILIFDEATSALDYESEALIQANMRRICQGRTVLVIAHRLSAVRHADRIVVLERGQIAEIGNHEELLARDAGIYAHLHALQAGLRQEQCA